MNYEELYQNFLLQEKDLKDKLNTLQKLHKSILKSMETGDLKSFSKDIQTMEETSKSQVQTLETMSALAADFDTKQYFEQGDFAAQMLEYCDDYGIDVKGDFPVYEMFPYKVRLDVENQDMYIDRKKVPCMRPQSFVKTVKAGQDRLLKASFNALTFANELADAYDLLLLKQGKAEAADLYLTNIYKVLAPMGRFRKDYDQQSFAFDLARLYSSGLEEIRDGRKFQFGPSRNNNKAIRILDNEGREQYLATIRFYK